MSRALQRRKTSSEDEGSGAYWMDTYGDLVTLLLTFFVFLFSFSNIDMEKWKSIAGAFSGTAIFSVPELDFDAATAPVIPTINNMREDVADEIDMSGMEEYMELYRNITSYIGENHLQTELLANPETRTLILRFSDNVLFTSGSAIISPAFTDTMNHIISMFEENKALIGMIRIEGHTDNVPIRTSQFEDNWALSITRAANVLRYFIESNSMDVTKVSAVGYGEFHPVADNNTPEGRAQNRRVDFVIESVNLK